MRTTTTRTGLSLAKLRHRLELTLAPFGTRDVADLRQRVEAIEAEIADLRTSIETVERHLGELLGAISVASGTAQLARQDIEALRASIADD
jgi:hypothetical protein